MKSLVDILPFPHPEEQSRDQSRGDDAPYDLYPKPSHDIFVDHHHEACGLEVDVLELFLELVGLDLADGIQSILSTIRDAAGERRGGGTRTRGR